VTSKILAQFLCRSLILFYFILLQMGEPLNRWPNQWLSW